LVIPSSSLKDYSRLVACPYCLPLLTVSSKPIKIYHYGRDNSF
jgi:hypothetical protein